MKSSAGTNRWLIGMGLLITLLTIATFSSSLTAELVHWDDDINILNNTRIHQLNADNVAWMFTDSSYTPRYRPLNWLSWATLYHVFGANPLPFHALTLLLHGINAALLFVVLVTLIQRNREETLSRFQLGCCTIATLLWSLHPLRVEAVAWVNCQIYTQSFFFLLLSLLLYLRATRSPAPTRSPAYWGAVVLFLCSLLTYPTAVAFVVVLVVIDLFLLKRLDLSNWRSTVNREVLMEKIPFAALAVAVGGIALWARWNAAGMWAEYSDASRLGVPDQAAQAFYIWAYYLWKPFAILHQSPVYTQLVDFRWTDWPFLASAAMIVSISTALVLMRRKQPVLLAVWVCYLALLVPMLGLTEHPHYPNDRYSYIVSTLVSALIAGALIQLTRNRFQQMIVPAGCAVVLIGLAVLSAQQTRVWQNSHTLFRHVLNTIGEDPYRADIFWRLGGVHASKREFIEAEAYYSKALEVRPGLIQAQMDLATVFIHTGRTNEAISHYRAALQEKPDDPLANYNLGIVLQNLGNVEPALNHYRKAVAGEEENVEYRLALAAALEQSGLHSDALGQLTVVLAFQPNSAAVHSRIGGVLTGLEQLPKAINHLRKAIELDPSNPEAHYNLGTALAMSGRVADATPHFIEASHLQPDQPRAHLACGMAYTQTGRFNEAVKSYRTALRLQPDLMPALVNLCWILCAHPDRNIRDGAEAIALAKKAVKVVDGKHPEAYDLLAAAFAEAGQWQRAVEAANHATQLAVESGRTDLLSDLKQKLELYESEQPFRM